MKPNREIDAKSDGEFFASELKAKWINPGPIAKGELIAHARLETPEAKIFADLHLVLGDLEFALACFRRLLGGGPPNSADLETKALAFAAVIAYGRGFKEGVRHRLDARNLAAVPGFDTEAHAYLIDLRDKHVAHSANNFEESEAFAIVVGTPQSDKSIRWRDGSGAGARVRQGIGLARWQIERAAEHTAALSRHVQAEIDVRRLDVHAAFAQELEQRGRFEWAPLVTMPRRDRVNKRRP